MTDEDLEALARDIRCLKNRAEIHDCLLRYCRGVDRLDWELAETAYHPDAIDNRGAITASFKDYLAWSRGNIETAAFTSHNMSNTTYDIDGDEAHGETYVLTMVVAADEARVTLGGARYLSRLERRDGEWRLIRQETAMDYSFTAPTNALPPNALRSLRSREDRSYARPLDLTAEARARYEAMPSGTDAGTK